MTIRADRRLALLAVAKMFGVGALVGLVAGIGMTIDDESPWLLLGAPATLASLGAATLGLVLAAAWWLLPGQVAYVLADGHLSAYRGKHLRHRVAVERIAHVEFDDEITWIDLVFSGWLGYLSPIPALEVTMTSTADRWDPTNGSVVELPRILVAGTRQADSLRTLRATIDDLQRVGEEGPDRV